MGLLLQTSLGIVAWSSLLFALLQSVCTFFAALDGMRTVVGISALVLADSTGKLIDSFHVDWLRVPMLSVAVAGSLLNLLVLWQVRRLRNNPAARWRLRPVSTQKLRMEWAQIALAALTLVLVAFEEWQHLRWAGHL
jgi:Co/Zn/Cd efflux system component